MSKKPLLSLIALVALAGCGGPLDDEALASLDALDALDVAEGAAGGVEQALAVPRVEDTINTCDNKLVELIAGSTGDRFSLDPAAGPQNARFSAPNLTGGVSQRGCTIAARFDVPTGFKAQLRLAVASGFSNVPRSGPGIGVAFSLRSGFTSRPPRQLPDLDTGPSVIDDDFRLKEENGERIDIQLDRTQDPRGLAATECGQQNVWFYVRPQTSTGANSGGSRVDLDLILASFRLVPCS